MRTMEHGTYHESSIRRYLVCQNNFFGSPCVFVNVHKSCGSLEVSTEKALRQRCTLERNRITHGVRHSKGFIENLRDEQYLLCGLLL